MRRVAAVIAAVAFGGSAWAQPAPRPVPPPANLKPATVERWIKAHIEPGDDLFALDEDTGVYLYNPSANQPPGGGLRRLWLRHERYAAREGVRSEMMLYDFDCAERRRRMLALDSYAGLNLHEPLRAGNLDIDAKDEARWIYPRPDSVGEALMGKACALRHPLLGNAAAAKP